MRLSRRDMPAVAAVVLVGIALSSGTTRAQPVCVERDTLTSHCLRWQGAVGPGAEPMLIRQGRADVPPVVPKIVGGIAARIEDHPWQVSLVTRKAVTRGKAWPGHFCGGSYIGGGWVITAAHCVDRDTRADDIVVVSGTADLKAVPAGSSSGWTEVERIEVHPGWAHDPKRDLRHDIALLRLRGGVTPPGAAPVAGPAAIATLPPSMMRAHTSQARASGWGRTLRTPDDDGSPVLQTVDLPAVPPQQCGSPQAYGSYFRADGMVCYGPRDASRVICSGDSGGPLTVERNGRRYLSGLSSFGRAGCQGQHAYSVFTRVEAYAPWVAQMTGLRKGWVEP